MVEQMNSRNVHGLVRPEVSSSRVAVQLRKQPILPILNEVSADYGEISQSVAVNVDYETNEKKSLWIDKDLFKEALHSMLVFSSRHSIRGKTINISLRQTGVRGGCISISYNSSHKNINEDDWQDFVNFNTGRRREILSQHGASVDFTGEKGNARIVLRFKD